MSNIAYRPDIDGLRAVAVVPVILFHAGAQWLPGGFVGVDIFFVISGYLISAIILREVGQGSFTFAGFYERRIRRIIPALLVMLLATVMQLGAMVGGVAQAINLAFPNVVPQLVEWIGPETVLGRQMAAKPEYPWAVFTALPAVVEAIGGRATVLVDGAEW